MKEIKYKRIYNDPDGMRYEWLKDERFYIPLFNRHITIKAGDKSDGATFARDLGAKENGWRKLWALFVTLVIYKVFRQLCNKLTLAWWLHDILCYDGCFDDGYRISNFVCSMVVSIQLHKDGYKVESYAWFFATFIGGGGEARKNGMLWVT